MPIDLKCRSCTSIQISRSHRRGFIDWVMGLFGLLPYRCNECDHRFHSRGPKESSNPGAGDAPHTGAI